MIQQIDTAAGSRAGTATKSKRFAGKRVAMVTFSPFPFDPRPRRAVEAHLFGTAGAAPAIWVMDSDGTNPRQVTRGLDDRGADHRRWLPQAEP